MIGSIALDRYYVLLVTASRVTRAVIGAAMLGAISTATWIPRGQHLDEQKDRHIEIATAREF